MTTYKKTTQKTVNGNAIYLQTSSNNSILRYKVKYRQEIIKPKGKLYKIAFVTCYRDLDPLESEHLYNKYPERFGMLVASQIREYLIDNNLTWNERENTK